MLIYVFSTAYAYIYFVFTVSFVGPEETSELKPLPKGVWSGWTILSAGALVQLQLCIAPIYRPLAWGQRDVFPLQEAVLFTQGVIRASFSTWHEVGYDMPDLDDCWASPHSLMNSCVNVLERSLPRYSIWLKILVSLQSESRNHTVSQGTHHTAWWLHL